MHPSMSEVRIEVLDPELATEVAAGVRLIYVAYMSQ